MFELYSNMAGTVPAFLDAFFSLEMLLALAIGILGGMLIGSLPGLSAVIGISLLLPVTYNMSPIPAISMLMAIYTTSILGGSFTAILVRIPGTAASAATLLDGYAMSQRGEGQRALNMSLFASACGGLFSGLCLLFIAPLLARVALSFDSAEYFLVGIFGITIIASLSDQSMAKGFAMGSLGMLLSTIGYAPISVQLRFTLGNMDLNNGFRDTVIILGIFSFSQVLRLVQKIKRQQSEKPQELLALKGKKLLSGADIKTCMPHIIRSSIIGTYVGVLPGAGANIASFIAYDQAKKTSKNKDKFGTGVIEGVAAPEAANNAVTGAAMIPLLTLGIPGSSAAAVLLGGLMIHGLTPGSALFVKQADITYPILFIFLITNIIMLPIGMIFAGQMKNVVKVNQAVLNTVVAVLIILGAFSVANRNFDLFAVAGFGLFGFFAREGNYSESAFILGALLGRMTEMGFTRALVIADALGISIWSYFLGRPMCIFLMFLIVLVAFGPMINRFRKNHAKKEKGA